MNPTMNSTNPNRGKDAPGRCSGSECARVREALVEVGVAMGKVIKIVAWGEKLETRVLELVSGLEGVCAKLSRLLCHPGMVGSSQEITLDVGPLWLIVDEWFERSRTGLKVPISTVDQSTQTVDSDVGSEIGARRPPAKGVEVGLSSPTTAPEDPLVESASVQRGLRRPSEIGMIRPRARRRRRRGKGKGRPSLSESDSGVAGRGVTTSSGSPEMEGRARRRSSPASSSGPSYAEVAAVPAGDVRPPLSATFAGGACAHGVGPRRVPANGGERREGKSNPPSSAPRSVKRSRERRPPSQADAAIGQQTEGMRNRGTSGPAEIRIRGLGRDVTARNLILAVSLICDCEPGEVVLGLARDGAASPCATDTGSSFRGSGAAGRTDDARVWDAAAPARSPVRPVMYRRRTMGGRGMPRLLGGARSPARPGFSPW